MTKLLRYACMLFFLASMPILTNGQCTVSAGSNIDKCIFSMDSVQLQGTVAGNFTVYNWTSTGSGQVGASTTLHAYYKYNQADITNGSVTLTLTASGGTCGSVTSQVTINLYKRPTIVGQDEFTVCGSTIPLTSTATGASAFVWSTMSGTGTFSSTTTANTQYTTSAADITRGFVLLEIKGTTPMSGCFHQDTVRVNIAASVSLNAGADQTICNSPANTVVYSSATGGYTSYVWTTSGTGTFLNPTELFSMYIASATDIAAGSVTLTLTGNNTTCGSASDSRIITILQTPIVSAGANQTICGNTAALTGTVTPSSGAILEWSTVIGSGTFTSTSILTPIYTTAAADQTRGYTLVRLSATSATGCMNEDTVRINIAGNASVNAGLDQTICAAAGSAVYPSASSTPGYTSYLWTTSGTGMFSNSAALLPSYIFSAGDIASGSVTLTLTGNSAACGAGSDVITYTILQRPTVSAGADQTVCVNTAVLNGAVAPSSGTSIQWDDVIASGTFSNTTTLTPTYTLSVADKTRGYALLGIRATSSNGCIQLDTVKVNILSAPIVFAGSNQVSCSGSVVTHGYAINATTKLWSTSGTGTFANTAKDTTTYVPSSADRASGQVILTYTAGNSCSSATSTTQIDFIATTPLVNAGVDESVCGNTTIQLSGSVVNAAGGIWTTSGTGNFLLSPSHLVTLYQFSAADKTAGSVSFTLTTYSAGGCGSVSDVKTVTISSGTLPSAYAGADQTSSITTQLNATVSNATSQLWETSGIGVFTPSPTSLNASYIPSADDVTAGSVILTLVATNSCGTASDALTVFTTTPSSISGTVKAGSNILDKGVVYLFLFDAIDSKKLVAVDTIKPSDNGVYEFSSVANGNYSVYAVPETVSTYAAAYLATYSGSLPAIDWTDAEQEVITNSSANVIDITLVAYTSALPNWNTGMDAISGAIFLNTPTPMMRLAGSDDVPLAGVVVYLKTLSGQVIAYTSTDKFGIYTFNNVLPGNYYIDPEYSQTTTFSANKIAAVDGNANTIEDGNVFVNRTTIATGILSANKSIQINTYPNPTSDNVHILLNKTGNYVIKILDETGVVHIDQEVAVTSNEAARISLASLNKGLYLIQITSGDEVYNTKVVKF